MAAWSGCNNYLKMIKAQWPKNMTLIRRTVAVSGLRFHEKFFDSLTFRYCHLLAFMSTIQCCNHPKVNNSSIQNDRKIQLWCVAMATKGGCLLLWYSDVAVMTTLRGCWGKVRWFMWWPWLQDAKTNLAHDRMTPRWMIFVYTSVKSNVVLNW